MNQLRIWPLSVHKSKYVIYLLQHSFHKTITKFGIKPNFNCFSFLRWPYFLLAHSIFPSACYCYGFQHPSSYALLLFCFLSAGLFSCYSFVILTLASSLETSQLSNIWGQQDLVSGAFLFKWGVWCPQRTFPGPSAVRGSGLEQEASTTCSLYPNAMLSFMYRPWNKM